MERGDATCPRRCAKRESEKDLQLTRSSPQQSAGWIITSSMHELLSPAAAAKGERKI